MEAITEALVASLEQAADQIILFCIVILIILAVLAFIIRGVKSFFRKIFK